MEIWIFGLGDGGDSATSDLDLGKKVGNLDWGGYSPTSDLDLGKKVGNLDLGGGYSPTSYLDLGKKVGNLDLGGVFSNCGFGLRKKSWKFGFLGWGGGILER